MERPIEYYKEGFSRLMLDKMEDHDWRSTGLADVTMRVAVPGPIVRALFKLYAENADLKARLEALESPTKQVADFRRPQKGATEHANLAR